MLRLMMVSVSELLLLLWLVVEIRDALAHLLHNGFTHFFFNDTNGFNAIFEFTDTFSPDAKVIIDCVFEIFEPLDGLLQSRVICFIFAVLPQFTLLVTAAIEK